MKRKYIIIGVLIVLILGLIVADFVINPVSGTSYGLLDISKEQITAVEIHHYGKGLTLTHPEYVSQLVDLFDCNLERRGNDYLTNRTGGDWSITFLAKNGSQSKSFLFLPGGGSGETKLKIGHYYYAADMDITNELLDSLFFDTSITRKVKEAIETAYLQHFSSTQGRPITQLDGIMSLDSTTDGIVYLYYGTFNDTVVWFTGGPIVDDDSASIYHYPLLGHNISYPTYSGLWATKDGQYHFLDDAYELGYLTDADIELIVKRHEMANHMLMNTSRPTSALEDAATPIAELIIDPEKAEHIAQVHYEQWIERYGTEPGRKLTFGQSIYEEIYYGTFGETTVWFSLGTSDAEENYTVAGYPFYCVKGFNIMAYNDGIFYSMEEAYLRGILSAADIAIISQRHAEAMGISKLSDLDDAALMQYLADSNVTILDGIALTSIRNMIVALEKDINQLNAYSSPMSYELFEDLRAVVKEYTKAK